MCFSVVVFFHSLSLVVVWQLTLFCVAKHKTHSFVLRSLLLPFEKQPERDARYPRITLERCYQIRGRQFLLTNQESGKISLPLSCWNL